MEEKNQPLAIISKKLLLSSMGTYNNLAKILKRNEKSSYIIDTRLNDLWATFIRSIMDECDAYAADTIVSIIVYCYNKHLTIDDIIAALKALKIEVVVEVNNND